MKAMSKRFKQEVAGSAAVIATLLIYIPFMEYPWAIYVAMSLGYTIMIFGLLWSSGKTHPFPGENARPFGEILQAHLAFLALVIGWIWFAQSIKPFMPNWIVVEGSDHITWLLVFALLGIVGVLIAELWWLSKKPKPDLQEPYSHSSQNR